MKYYNTTGEEGKQLKKNTEKAVTQDKAILLHFINYPNTKFGASDLSIAFPQWPITSIRRSLNTLETEWQITRDGDKRMGKYGREEFVYRLSSKQLNLF